MIAVDTSQLFESEFVDRSKKAGTIVFSVRSRWKL
jgi:hypothetical protein